jgi:hypothetical protein
MIKPNRNNISEVLFEYYLSLLEKTVRDALENPNWKQEWSISKEQYEEFKRYSIPLLKKVFKFNKSKAENTFNFFWLHYGIRIQ